MRSVLDAEVRRQQLRAAADTYAEFLRRHRQEAEALEAWASAPLEKTARPRRPK